MVSKVLRPRCLAAAVLLASVSALAPVHAIAPERALYLLTDDNRIGVVFDGAAAQAAPAAVTGLVAGDALVAIDVRPQNHRLYGLGFDSANGTVRLYHIDLASGTPRAAAVGTTGAFVAADGTTAVPIAGTAFGIDFNPTVDRVRVVNDAGQNFRMNPNNGALVDGNAGAAGTQMDGALNGAATRAVDTAYTNSIVNASVTTQYALDSAANELYIQNPPNNGTLTSARAITLGGNPLDFGADAGLDIPPGINVATGSASASGLAYAALTVGGNAGLYRIELSTGVATSVGALGGLAVRDLAVANLVPAGLALSADGSQLHRFALDRPGTLVSVAVTGLAAGERLVGIDLRPTTAQHYGLGVDPVADTATLYVVDPQTGAATAIGAQGQIAAAFADGSYGVDFNPSVDRVRVVSDSGLNLRLHPDTGALAATDGAINGSGVTGAAATAYANNFATPTFTTQYTIDPATDALYIQNPPNNGTQTQRQALTLGGDPLDVSAAAALDIPPGAAPPGANGASLGDGYAALTVGGVTGLYRVSLSNGATTSLGALGSGTTAIEGLVVPFGTVGPERGIVVLTNTGEIQLATESQPNQVTAALALQGLVGDDALVAPR